MGTLPGNEQQQPSLAARRSPHGRLFKPRIQPGARRRGRRRSLTAVLAVNFAILLAVQVSPALASHPDITGVYSGSGVTTLTGCDDPGDNGTFSFSSTVTISNQTGGTFSGSAVLTATVQGFNLRETIEASGTVTTAGALSGTFTHTLLVDGGFDSSGGGTFTGQVSGKTLILNISGMDTVGDSCNFTGSITGTRPSVPPVPAAAAFPLLEGFETGSLADYWTASSTNDGRIRVTRANAPNSGSFHVTMDDAVDGGLSSLNELILTIDLTGASDVTLLFFHKEFNDEDDEMPMPSFTESSPADGLAISADGHTWYTVASFTDALGVNLTYGEFFSNLDGTIAAAGISYNSRFKIKFQQFDNFPIPDDGFAFDDIRVIVDADGDFDHDPTDNCPGVSNPDQRNNDNDDEGNACDSDDDNDGMPDAFEIEFGLNRFDSSDAASDNDGDGLTALEEFQAGRDPTANEPAVLQMINSIMLD